MSRFRLLLIVSALGAIGSLRADPLSEGRARFAEREFQPAAELLEKAASTGQPSAAVFFELGRTYAELGNEARAALNFRRALILDPKFAPAREALQKSEVQLGLTPEKSTWRTWVAIRLPMDAMALLGTSLFWIGAFLFLIAIFSWRKLPKFALSFALLAAGLGLIAVVWFCDPRVAARSEALVMTNGGATVLGAPTENSEHVAKLAEGSVVDILSQRGRWFYGRTPSGVKGWFPTEGIVPLIPAS